jgi:DNA modification methylase
LNTTHSIIFDDARLLGQIPDGSVELIVTSPPYPMIEMWDETFRGMSPAAAEALSAEEGPAAFEAMHRELDKVWAECFRILKPGCLACINIGDAVRTIAGSFRIYSNHSRILTSMCGLGFSPLPDVLWRKQTNTPNKFMGSGMLPAGAYVTYEHEYILIFRKGSNRPFSLPEEKRNRRRSAFFWEERNVWFSDVWTDLKGTSQELTDPATRARSAAFPFELAYRLVNMHSVYGDTVVDPFLGTGTTMLAALASGRSSIGIEIVRGLRETIRALLARGCRIASDRIRSRFDSHREFVAERISAGAAPKHASARYGFPVITSQEVELEFFRPIAVKETAPDRFELEYASDEAEESGQAVIDSPPSTRFTPVMEGQIAAGQKELDERIRRLLG